MRRPLLPLLAAVIGFVAPISIVAAQGPTDADWLAVLKHLAERGDLQSQCVLGEIYERGEAGPRNYAEAAKWYRKCAQQGDGRAQLTLGLFYAQGLGVPKNDSEACFWSILAANSGIKRAAKLRAATERHLTAQQLSGVRRRAAEWRPIKPVER